MYDNFHIDTTPRYTGVSIKAKEKTTLLRNDNGSPYARTYIDRLNELLDKKWVVLYDVKDSRGWFVDAVTALLHLVRVSLEYKERVEASRHLYRFKMVGHKENPQGSDHPALNILENKENYGQTLLHGSSQTLQNIVEDKLATLELILEDQRDLNSLSKTAQGVLEGFMFEDITKGDGISTRLCSRTLPPQRITWQYFTRKVYAAVLFGFGFGELIKSQSTGGLLCQSFGSVPTGQEYLAISTSDVMKIAKRKGNTYRKPWRLIGDVYWYCPDEPCKSSLSNGSCKNPCELAHVLFPAADDINPGESTAIPCLSANGAIIFGYNSQYKSLLESCCQTQAENPINQPAPFPPFSPFPSSTVIIIGALAVIPHIHDLNFYWKTLLTSILATVLYCIVVIPMQRRSPDQRHSRRTTHFLMTGIIFFVKGVGLLLLVTWLFLLSPAHTATLTLLDKWTECYMIHPPYEPSKTLYDPGVTSEIE